MSDKLVVDANKRHYSYEDKLSLVDIYLTIKRNRQIFFVTALLSFLVSVGVGYFKFLPDTPKEIVSNSSITEYVLWIEIGKIYGVNAHKSVIDNPENILAKIKKIYIPKVVSEFMKSEGGELDQSTISASYPKKTDLIVVKAIKTSNNIDYGKVLMSLAGYILNDHNKGLSLSDKEVITIKPTKVIQEPIKVINKKINKNINNNKNININIMLITVFGIIFGLFIGGFSVFMKEFFKEVKEAEELS